MSIYDAMPTKKGDLTALSGTRILADYLKSIGKNREAIQELEKAIDEYRNIRGNDTDLEGYVKTLEDWKSSNEGESKLGEGVDS